MAAYLSDQVVLSISNTSQAAYFSPYQQRPPGTVYPYSKNQGNHQTSTAKIVLFSQPDTSQIFSSPINDNQDIYASILQQQTLDVSHLISKIKTFVCDPVAPTDVDSISETIDNAYEVIERFGPVGLDLGFVSTPEHINGEHLAALLRVTNPYKKMVPNWDNALKINIKSLEIAQLDIGDVLAGLIQD